MLKGYFKRLYGRTMHQAYGRALKEIGLALSSGGECLDCGASTGYWFERLSEQIGLSAAQYHGIEWNQACVSAAREKDIDIIHGDLNRDLPFEDDRFTCIYALSVLEHLLNPCRFLNECYRILKTDGRLILLTPNISTYFTAALILMGKMPSSGPHPDSSTLLKSEEMFKVSSESLQWDAEDDTPMHRHLIVFSYRVLWRYLHSMEFSKVTGYGFGLYPFPNFMQPILEKVDPFHCHQMVLVAQK